MVITTDSYRDLWEPFYNLLFRFWQSPYKIYHVSNCSYEHQFLNINHIWIDEKQPWVRRLICALDRIPESDVLLLLADFLIIKSVDTSRIVKLYKEMIERDAAFIRLFPCPGPTIPLKDSEDIGLIQVNTPYSISTQAAIWNKNRLRRFSSFFSTDSELELLGSKISDQLGGLLLCVTHDPHRINLEEGNYPITYICTAVIQGKWSRDAIKYSKHLGIELDLRARPTMTPLETYYHRNYFQLPIYLKICIDLINRLYSMVFR